MILKSRAALADVANALELKTAVEVGTHQAVFASEFMARFRGEITLVDPWEGFDIFPTFYPAFDESSRSRDVDFEIAKSAMEPFIERVKFWRMASESAAVQIEDESVGIVYIDALHSYESVIKDISLWFPKVRKGGIISGHDFHQDLIGVVQAVMEFAFQNNFEIQLTTDQMPSWWMIKR